MLLPINIQISLGQCFRQIIHTSLHNHATYVYKVYVLIKKKYIFMNVTLNLNLNLLVRIIFLFKIFRLGRYFFLGIIAFRN